MNVHLNKQESKGKESELNVSAWYNIIYPTL